MKAPTVWCLNVIYKVHVQICRSTLATRTYSSIPQFAACKTSSGPSVRGLHFAINCKRGAHLPHESRPQSDAFIAVNKSVELILLQDWQRIQTRSAPLRALPTRTESARRQKLLGKSAPGPCARMPQLVSSSFRLSVR